MKPDFMSAMNRALAQTRAGTPFEATRTIKDALGLDATAAQGAADASVRKAASRPLGTVIDSLVNGKKARMSRPGKARGPKPPVAEGAAYARRQHRTAFGDREVAVYIPAPRPEPIRALVIMLHGCTQDADDFATGTQMNRLANLHNLAVAYPEQPRGDNALGCWNWFRPGDQARGRGEPALLADLAQTLAAELSVPAQRTFCAGLSAGGAMAAILGTEYPDVFAAIGVHSGLAPGAAHDVASAYSAMQGHASRPARRGASMPAIVFHGAADATVHPDNADHVLAAALGGAQATIIPGGAGGSTLYLDATGRKLAESWRLPGMGHAWSGGSPHGSHTCPTGVDASSEMIRFFLEMETETRP